MRGRYDVAVIGAGLIGASAACHLAEHCRTILIEQEPRPGYHSSGRSAAVLLPPYGGPIARALTRASMPFLMRPGSVPGQPALTEPRGALFLASGSQLDQLEHWRPEDSPGVSGSRMLSAKEAVQHVPILVPEQIAAALWMPDVLDIEAAALLQAFLGVFKDRGGDTMLDARVGTIRRTDRVWTIETPTSVVQAKIVVNAAGGWADEIAELAGAGRKDLIPTRRTMVVVDAPPDVDTRAWPLVSDVAETFYFKPDAGRLVVSPADHTPIAAQDVQPEEWDVAVAIDRLETATRLRVGRVAHKWAGLRTFTPDEEPIIGFDTEIADFLWAAGFGGFGVQTAYAAGRCCAAAVFGTQLPDELGAAGIDLARLSPRRLAVRPHV